MNSKKSLSSINSNQEKPLSQETQEDVLHSESDTKKGTQMELKKLVATVVLSSTLALAPTAEAKPNMTEEQLAKAREVASKLNPPVNFDEMLIEADRLGVECNGNLTIRANIRACLNGIKIEQSKEEIAKLDEEILASQARQAESRARLSEKVADLVNDIEQKLNQ